MSANHFVLRHHDVEVEYTAGVTPGIPALTYCDGSSPKKSFTGAEIATDETALGTLVSVPLQQTIDTGGERFGFVLPQLDVPQGQSGHVRHGGRVREVHRARLVPQGAAVVAGHRAARHGADRHSAALTARHRAAFQPWHRPGA